MLQARALYDNHSESSEELSFQIGDILTVVEKDVNGLEGWWLCYCGNKLGIAPGNRLRIVKKCTTLQEDKDKTLTRHDCIKDYNNYDTVSSLDDKPSFIKDILYDLPTCMDKPNILPLPVRINECSSNGSTESSCGSCSPNRSSLLSMLSTGSSSLSSSTRSSADVSFSTYDTLPQRNSANNRNQQNMLRCGESKKAMKVACAKGSNVGCLTDDLRDSYLEDYSIPKKNNFNDSFNSDNEFVNVADSKSFFEDLYDSPRRCMEQIKSGASTSSLSSPTRQLSTMSSFDDSTLKSYTKEDKDQLYDVPQLLLHQSGDFNKVVVNKNNCNDMESNCLFSKNYNGEPNYDQPFQELSQANNTNSVAPTARLSIFQGNLPDKVHPVLYWQLDIQKYNQKLRCLAIEMEALNDNTCNGIESEKWMLKQSQIKLCCLSLKSAVKELLDFFTNFKLEINEKDINLENLKSRVETLKVSLKEFEDKTNELLICNVKNNDVFDKKKSIDKQFLQSLLNVANKLPQVSNLLASDISSCFSVSNAIGNKRNVVVSGVDNQTILSPTKPTLPKALAQNIQQPTCDSVLVKKSIQNRPLPAPPLNNFRLTTSLKPQQQIHYRNPSPTQNSTHSQQNLSSGLNDNNSDVRLPNFFDSPKSTALQSQQGRHSNPNAPPCLSQQPNNLFILQRQHTFPQPSLQQLRQHSQSDPLVGGDESDSLLVAFYASQIEMHLQLVKKSASKFRKTMFDIPTKNHPQLQFQFLPTPKEFVLRSKFVILAAHKLVYVADAIARNLADPSQYLDIAEYANKLCNTLKIAVNSTKDSALHHENVDKRDHMVKSILAVETASEELCLVIRRYKQVLDSDDEEVASNIA